jgi:hypothetical protein
MWPYRLLLVLAAVAGLVLFVKARARPADPPGPSPPLAPTPADDPRAREALARALEALADDRVQWLEAGIWQRVELPGLAYEADGRYLMAPGHRFRLEVRTHVDGGQGALLLVCDGSTLWQATGAGAGGWETVTRLGLQDVFAALNGPAGSPRLRTEFLQGPTFTGVAPLLRNLSHRLAWVRHDTARRGGAEWLELTGVWPADVAAALAPPDRPWPVGLPRQCRVCLDARTFWPHRIEWRGPCGGRGEDALLAQTEFRTPVFNRPLPPERCAREFTFQPGSAHVTDQTGTVTASLAARAQQLAAQPAPR